MTAAEGGDAEAQVRLGLLHLRDEDPASAAIWIQRAADAGRADAQFVLGWMHHRGIGVARDDDTARAWLAAAAASGSAMARTGLAISYVRDDDEELQEEGVAWLRLAASQGFAHAQYDLAMVLLEGRSSAPGPTRSDGHEPPRTRVGRKRSVDWRSHE